MSLSSPRTSPRSARSLARTHAPLVALLASLFVACNLQQPSQIQQEPAATGAKRTSTPKKDAGKAAPQEEEEEEEATEEETPEKETPAPETTADAGATPDDGGVCSLARSGLTFDNGPGGAACTTCMQDKCCVSVVGCFAGDPACPTLHGCVAACAAAPATDAGTGEGGGGGGGDGGVAGSGNACIDACRAKHPAVVEPQKAFDTCFNAQCKASCK